MTPLFTFVLPSFLPPSIHLVNRSPIIRASFKPWAAWLRPPALAMKSINSVLHRKGKKRKKNPETWNPVKRYLKRYFRCHGEAVSDDGLLLRGATFPAVQLDAAAARQKNLLVHLH